MEWTAKGSIRVSEEGDIVVDLRGELVGLEALLRRPVARGVSSSIAAVPDADIEAEITRAREAVGVVVAGLGDALVDLLARENKRGRVAESRVLREVWRPLVGAVERQGVEAVAWGLEQAVAKGVPNVNYAKKAAESFQQQPSNRPPVSGGRYDRIGE